MSHIFDALQRSETERTGIEVPPLALPTELLQIAEQTAAERGTVISFDTAVTTETAVECGMPVVGGSPIPTAPVETTAGDADLDQFSQFQSLQVLVPPQSKIVCVTNTESLAAEKFRFLSVRLRQLRQSRPLKKVLITSSIPQEGKSMVAANLACALAQRTQEKTLLLDGDLRRPSLGQLFGLGKLSGISEWLQGEQGPMTCIRHLEGPSLWILAAGNVPTNPLELLQSGKLSVLLDQLTACFDWIVIDSPPVLPLGDTSIWMRLADGVLLVTRPGVSEKQQLEKGLEVIEQSKLIGALLNGSANAAHSNYYYQYSRPLAKQPNSSSKQ